MACTDPNAAEAVRLTGYGRYLDLCNPSHPAYNPRSHAIVAAIVSDPSWRTEAPAPDAPAPSVCPYRDACSCHGPIPICLHATHGPARGRADRLVMGDGASRPVWRVDAAACAGCPLPCS